jgi:hypothetical protein
VPAFFAVPKFHATNEAPVSRQIDRTGPPAVRNAFAKGDFFGCSIPEVHHHAMEVHRTATHPQLHRAEFPVPHAHPHDIMIAVTVDTPASEKSPPAFIVSISVSVLSVKRTAKNKRRNKPNYPQIFAPQAFMNDH